MPSTWQAAAWEQLAPKLKPTKRPLRYSPTAWDHTGRAIIWNKGEEKESTFSSPCQWRLVPCGRGDAVQARQPTARRPRCGQVSQPPTREPTTTRSPRRNSRRSSTALSSPNASTQSSRPETSASTSSATTTTSTTTRASRFTHQPQSTTAPTLRSEPSAKPPSTRPSRPTQYASATRHRSLLNSPRSSGSINPTQRRLHRVARSTVSHST